MPASHTPGPWVWNGNTLRPEKPDPDRSAVYSILDAEGGYGFLGSDWRETGAELDADRVLIAQAPDLLADGRLGQVQFLRRTVETAEPGGSLETPQGVQWWPVLEHLR